MSMRSCARTSPRRETASDARGDPNGDLRAACADYLPPPLPLRSIFAVARAQLSGAAISQIW